MSDRVVEPMDSFELALSRRLQALSEPAVRRVDAVEVARQMRARRGARRAWVLNIPPGRLAWLIGAALLLVGAAILGGQWSVRPNPNPNPIVVSRGGVLLLVDPTRGAVTELGPGTSGVWSPDRTRIAFLMDGALWTMAADGSDRQLAASDAAGLPAWSSDGRNLLTVSTDGSMSFEVVAANGRERRRLPYGMFKDFGMGAWSPGGRIALPLRDGIYLVDPDTTEASHLAAASDDIAWMPRYSPDGQRLAYDARSGLHVINADGSGDRLLDARIPLTQGLDWSPDGAKLAYALQRQPDVWVASIDSVAPSPIFQAAPSEVAVSVAWSLDGRRLAVLVGARPAGNGIMPESLDLWLVNADGSSPRRVLEGLDAIGDFGPDWW
jgi:Tol biopolymer transport system component